MIFELQALEIVSLVVFQPALSWSMETSTEVGDLFCINHRTTINLATQQLFMPLFPHPLLLSKVDCLYSHRMATVRCSGTMIPQYEDWNC